MLKKLMMMSMAVLTLAACNDEADDGVQYASNNPEIIDGIYSGRNMHFTGTVTVTNTTDGTIYTDPEAWFEFAGGTELVIYMHQTRFSADMEPLDLRMYRLPYTPGTGASLTFSATSSAPQVRVPNETGGGSDYKTHDSYTFTGIEGSIDNVDCRISLTCNVDGLESWRMTYEGRLLTKK